MSHESKNTQVAHPSAAIANNRNSSGISQPAVPPLQAMGLEEQGDNGGSEDRDIKPFRLGGTAIQSTGPGATTVQRFIDPYALDGLFDDALVRALKPLIGEYNRLEKPPASGYYNEDLITVQQIRQQLVRLAGIDQIIKDKDPKKENPFLDDLRRNIEADKVYLNEQQNLLLFAETNHFDPHRLMGLYSEPGGRQLITSSVAAAGGSPVVMKFLSLCVNTKELSIESAFTLINSTVAAAVSSPAVMKLLGMCVNMQDLSVDTMSKLIPQFLENISLRKYMAALPDNDVRLSAAQLKKFVSGVDSLTDFFKHLISVRNLEEETFLPVLSKCVDALFRGEKDYQTIATELAFNLPKPATMLAIASEFTEGMSKLGYTIFLAGGGAIRFRGGPRPVADLDFRMDPMPGLTSFGSSHGKELLRMVNRLLEISKNSREYGLNYSMFSAAGKKAMTIGTHNWFRLEISLSINQAFPHQDVEPSPFRIHSEEYIKHVDPKAKATTTVNLLTLTDLFRDKLKTAITRTKQEEVNYKKVAQDLFDIVSIVMMFRAQGINVLDPDVLMGHLRARVDQYKVQNLEPLDHDIPAFDVEKVAMRMLYRLVHTARAHLQEGPRNEIFMSLWSHSSMDVLDALNSLTGINVTGAVAAFDGYDIAGWFRSWNEQGATDEERMKVPSANPGLARLNDSPPEPAAFDSNVQVAYILERAPELAAAHDMRIFYILLRSKKYLRNLKNSNDPVEVMAAFSEIVSVRSFSRFYGQYNDKSGNGYVKGAKEGLILLEPGRAFIESQIKKSLEKD